MHCEADIGSLVFLQGSLLSLPLEFPFPCKRRRTLTLSLARLERFSDFSDSEAQGLYYLCLGQTLTRLC
jgi:hypothetical protein